MASVALGFVMVLLVLGVLFVVVGFVGAEYYSARRRVVVEKSVLGAAKLLDDEDVPLWLDGEADDEVHLGMLETDRAHLERVAAVTQMALHEREDGATLVSDHDQRARIHVKTYPADVDAFPLKPKPWRGGTLGAPAHVHWTPPKREEDRSVVDQHMDVWSRLLNVPQ
jgi:hypothetical protein